MGLPQYGVRRFFCKKWNEDIYEEGDVDAVKTCSRCVVDNCIFIVQCVREAPFNCKKCHATVSEPMMYVDDEGRSSLQSPLQNNGVKRYVKTLDSVYPAAQPTMVPASSWVTECIRKE